MISKDFAIAAYLTNRGYTYTRAQCRGIEFHGDEPLVKLSAAEELVEKLRTENAALKAEIKRLEKIETAAKNLIAQKGRHNTEIAYNRLVEALK